MIFISQDNYAFLQNKSKVKEFKIFNKVFKFIINVDNENQFDDLSNKIILLFEAKSRIYTSYNLEQILILIIFDLLSKKEEVSSDFFLKEILNTLKQQ